MEMIRITSLTKKYGNRIAVDNLNMVVNEGDLFGFIGPNGAGKTSTIRMVATLLAPDGGEIWVAGHSVQNKPRAVRQVIGYMPDFFGVYNDMKVWEYLDFFAACYDIPEHKRAGMLGDLLELVELSHRRDDQLESLSRGMKQRLSLARTLIHDPKILILDEPASGLDPRARIEIRELLLELAAMGKTILFSTHILTDVAEICTQVGILEAGKLIAAGPLEDLAKRLVPQRMIHIRLLNNPTLAQDLLAGLPEVHSLLVRQINEEEKQSHLVQFSFIGDDLALSGLLAALVEAGALITQFTEEQHDLEEVFMRATKGLVT